MPPLLPTSASASHSAPTSASRAGGAGAHSSGDLFLCFSTANRGPAARLQGRGSGTVVAVDMLPDTAVAPLFWAAIESDQEAILNALCAPRR